MIYLLPFLNAFVLFILTNENQILYKYYDWFQNEISPRLPIPNNVLGGCILCTSFWLGAIQLPLMDLSYNLILLIPYNAVITDITYKQLNENT